MRKPDFFIVGAAKSGTTSFQEYLKQHPRIFMPPGGEPNHFARDLDLALHITNRDERKYLSLFDGAGPATCLGEKSVWYLYSKTAATEISAFNEQAKIIIILRNPVDMVYSLHGQFLYTSNEDILSFQEALAVEDERRQGKRIPSSCHFPQGLLYSQVVDFAPQVQRYFDVFGRDKVCVLLFEDLVEKTPEVYRQVLEFLGVDPGYQPDFEVFNSAKPVRNLGLRRMIRENRPLAFFVRQLPPAFRHRIGNILGKMPGQTIPRSKKLDPGVRHELQSRFLPNVEQLSEVLGRDVTPWCKH